MQCFNFHKTNDKMSKFTSELKEHFQKPENAHNVTGDLDRFVFSFCRKMRSNGMPTKTPEAEMLMRALVNESLIEQGHKPML